MHILTIRQKSKQQFLCYTDEEQVYHGYTGTLAVILQDNGDVIHSLQVLGCRFSHFPLGVFGTTTGCHSIVSRGYGKEEENGMEV